eukprot:c21164_g2_i1 orf=103-438(-)
MVDLFGRAGHFDKAMAVIKNMPFFDHYSAWLAVLAACQKWENAKLGGLAFEHAIRLDDESAVAYVCMSKIYAATGMLEDADKIETFLKRQLGRSQDDPSGVCPFDLWTFTK